MSDVTESDDARMRRVLMASGISDHEGGGGDTYYRRPTWHMLDELADWANDLEQQHRERETQTLVEQLVSATLQPEVIVTRRDLLAAVLDRLDVLEAVADAAQAFSAHVEEHDLRFGAAIPPAADEPAAQRLSVDLATALRALTALDP